MSRKKKILLSVGLLVVIAVFAYANLAFKRTSGLEVTVEKIQLRDLEAIVSVSGKIQPKRSVNVSAETSGKVVQLEVDEGQTVKAGQFLLQIDPRNLQSMFDNRQASLSTAQSTLEQTRQQVENARLAVKQAEDNLRRQEDQFKNGLISKEAYENAVNSLAMQKTNLRQSEQSVLTQETRIKMEQANLDSAKYDLNKVRIEAPIDGIVTRRNIELGETAMIGTMNNAGTVLLTIADMSVLEAQVDVDETDIPHVRIGQVAKITIDALPDQTFKGRVTEVGNSPIAGTSATSATRATDFRVVVTIEGVVPNVRPGFTCTAVITTATRQKAISVPIQATTVREMIVDEKGQLVRDEQPAGRGERPRRQVATNTELKPGQTRKEIEGVFVVHDGRAVYTPVKTGIAGEKFFEVLDGLKEGDEVITGPFASVRNLKDGELVKPSTATTTGPTKS